MSAEAWLRDEAPCVLNIKAFISRRVGDEHAEDVYQNVFLKMWRLKDTLTDTDLCAYMYRVARTTVADFFSGADKPVENAGGFVEYFDEGIAGTEEAVLNSATIEKLLDKLPDNERLVVELVDLIGMTQQEVADRLEISQSAVSKQRAAAHARMRRLL